MLSPARKLELSRNALRFLQKELRRKDLPPEKRKDLASLLRAQQAIVKLRQQALN